MEGLTWLPSLGRAFLFLGIPFVLAVSWFQWKWAKTCIENIQVLVAQKGGGGSFMLAPRAGGEIAITDHEGNTRMWPVNELATIDVTYPGVGFVPKFLQKTIRMAIVNEGDWEPMLNRSPHREKIASPDVIDYLRALIENTETSDAVITNEKTVAKIQGFIKTLSSGPTREMIADPATLGNLAKSTILKQLAQVSDELTDLLKGVIRKLDTVKGPNPIIVYIGLGLSCILNGFVIFKVMPALNNLELIGAIAKALGVSIGVE